MCIPIEKTLYNCFLFQTIVMQVSMAVGILTVCSCCHLSLSVLLLYNILIGHGRFLLDSKDKLNLDFPNYSFAFIYVEIIIRYTFPKASVGF